MTARTHPTQHGGKDRLRATPLAAAFTLLLLLMVTGASPRLLAGQQPAQPVVTADRHYGTAIDQQLWTHPWAHGYQHGYEDGFHHGEWDHQMFEPPRSPKKQADWKHADRGYQPAMGNRDRFREGYRAGFATGYNDAYGGSPFQALMELAQKDPAFACPECRPVLLAERQASAGHQP